MSDLIYQEFRIEDKSGQLGNLPLVQGFVLQGFALPPRSVRRKCAPCYHGAHHCKVSPCHHGAATSEWQPRIGMESLVNSNLANHNNAIVIRDIIINSLMF